MSAAAQDWLRMTTVVAIVCLAASCAVRSESELHGAYVADYAVASEKLALNRDGTFVQTVTLKSKSAVLVARGAWHYDAQSGYVTFDANFLHVVDQFGKWDPDYERRLRGLTVYPVARYCWVVSIGSEEGVFYKKE